MEESVSVGHRIQQLEELVRTLLAQQQSTPDVDPDGLIRELSSQAKSPQSVSTVPQAPLDENTLVPAIDRASISRGNEVANPPAPSPSEPGSMRLSSHVVSASYVGSVHWAAVLDSISELKDHYEEEEESRMLDTNDHVLLQSPGPRLLYEPVHTTKADLLASIPPRPVVDRLVARYFITQGVVPSILHSGHFLQEYDKFWQDPPAIPCIWIGLLFSVMSVATLFQHSIDDPTDPEIHERVRLFREQTLHSLILGQYTKGGEYVLETLINYLIYLRLSSQMALLCVLKSQQYDTAEPRNLLDSDFDDNTTDLPPSRPETEVTPVLYSLAKGRIDNMMGLVSDLVNDTKEHPYTEIMELDRKLQEAEETQADGLLYPARWARWMLLSSRPRAVFLLGVSILCYYVQLVKTQSDVSLDESTGTEIHGRLRNAYPLWLQSTTVSREAKRAIDYLSLRLELQEQEIGEPLADPMADTPQDTNVSLDQFTWGIYDGKRPK
ncbi:uncharacterized protein FSUBG_62 [Fusarium subglutinans]|uniref:Transcription factor domain-containing protein n=1 Tax=Gibberella subglutinans TaxID=42677 RepID=A0A8H5QGL8_GIBSU|nr:uncharacterized protein FSUBG_62 [Fusarium subglutinans]KAF5614182.1 hypothetical protein FSUBG_62 [Fusarium subglutinans]